MKNILISIRPQYVAKILNKEKTIEVRKRFPSDYVGWVYIYCCKQRKNEIGCHINYEKVDGKVVARFWCDKVEEIKPQFTKDNKGVSYITETKSYIELCNESRLLSYKLNNYLLSKNGYAIHITKLEIFDKPKEIREFETRHWNSKNSFERDNVYQLTRAPQSWCYIEV